MRSPRLSEEKIAKIRLMRRTHSLADVVAKTGVSETTVLRYTVPGYAESANRYSRESAQRRRDGLSVTRGEARDVRQGRNHPLYDPKRDGVKPLSITGELMGDPRPGRRELVAKRQRYED